MRPSAWGEAWASSELDGVGVAEEMPSHRECVSGKCPQHPLDTTHVAVTDVCGMWQSCLLSSEEP